MDTLFHILLSNFFLNYRLFGNLRARSHSPTPPLQQENDVLSCDLLSELWSTSLLSLLVKFNPLGNFASSVPQKTPSLSLLSSFFFFLFSNPTSNVRAHFLASGRGSDDSRGRPTKPMVNSLHVIGREVLAFVPTGSLGWSSLPLRASRSTQYKASLLVLVLRFPGQEFWRRMITAFLAKTKNVVEKSFMTVGNVAKTLCSIQLHGKKRLSPCQD